MDRRSLLAALCGTLAGAACSSAQPEPKKPAPPPLAIGKLDDLATAADLVWMIRAKPRTIAQIPFLIPAIGRIIPEPHFDTFKTRTGFDPRQVHEALLLKYGPALDNAEAQIVRHNVDPVVTEKRFFARLTSDAERFEDHPELVRISGTIGRSKHAFARIGRDIVAYQQRGNTARGPVTIASLFARGKLTKAPRLLAGEPLASLVSRFGEAPVVAAALGPFTDEWKNAAHGLLEIATAVAAAARPTARDHVGFALALTGGFGKDAAKAGETLRVAWDEIAMSTMGRLLGLDRPIEEPIAAGHEEVVTLAVELDAGRLSEGLKALVEQDLEAIMRLD